MKIEIVTSEDIASAETGFGSYGTCLNLLYLITSLGHKVSLSSCHFEGQLQRIISRKPDLVILATKMIHADDGEDIWLSEYFEQHGIPYSGSSKATFELISDMQLSTEILLNAGIETPALFKEKNTVSLTSNNQSFAHFETHLSGSSYTASILLNSSGDLLISAVEVLLPSKHTRTETLAKINNPELRQDLSDLAKESYIALGAKGFARIDIESDEEGQLYFMAIDLLPDLTPETSNFVKAFQIDRGISFNNIIEHIIYQHDSEIGIEIPSHHHLTSPSNMSRKINHTKAGIEI